MSRSRQTLLLGSHLLASIGCLFWITGPALAVTSVYSSPADDGLPGSTQIPEIGVQSVYLYIDGGPSASSTGSACHDGEGDEVCGYNLELSGLDGMTLSSFNADPGADLLVNLSASSMRVNGLDTQSPTPGPQRIGELLVNSVSGGQIEVTAAEVVGAGLESETLAPTTLVAAPEPGPWLLLGSGIGLLGILARRRTEA